VFAAVVLGVDDETTVNDYAVTCQSIGTDHCPSPRTAWRGAAGRPVSSLSWGAGEHAGHSACHRPTGVRLNDRPCGRPWRRTGNPVWPRGIVVGL